MTIHKYLKLTYLTLLDRVSFSLKFFRLKRNELFLNQSFCLIPLIIDVAMAPRKKKAIIIHKILSNVIDNEKACPELIISERGSKESKFQSILNKLYSPIKNNKVKLSNKNNKN